MERVLSVERNRGAAEADLAPDPSGWTAEILATARAVVAAAPSTQPVAIWDFDGTLLHGDCSEGLPASAEHPGYPGLAELAIERGYSRQYGPGESARCWQEYHRLAQRKSRAAAHAALVQAFAGARESELRELARAYFATTLRAWFHPAARQALRALEASGVRCFVLSASADFFVKGAAPLLSLPEDRLRGIRLREGPEGALSPELVLPFPSGQGKLECLRQLLAEKPADGRTRVPIAAFGDSLETDGPMLEAVAGDVLPAGKPFVALVNSPQPPPPGLRALTFPPASAAS